jgi:hypothetical protein
MVKRTNNNLQNITQKTKYRTTRTPLIKLRWSRRASRSCSICVTLLYGQRFCLSCLVWSTQLNRYFMVNMRLSMSLIIASHNKDIKTLKRVGNLLTRLTQPQFCNCPKPGSRFPTSHVIVFLVQWVQFRWYVIVRFLDIGGIDDHPCLNFLFITYLINLFFVDPHSYLTSDIYFGLLHFQVYCLPNSTMTIEWYYLWYIFLQL